MAGGQRPYKEPNDHCSRPCQLQVSSHYIKKVHDGIIQWVEDRINEDGYYLNIGFAYKMDPGTQRVLLG